MQIIPLETKSRAREKWLNLANASVTTEYVLYTIPKVASTSLNDALPQPVYHTQRHKAKDIPLRQVAIVRNPYERFVSCWAYMNRRGRYRFYRDWDFVMIENDISIPELLDLIESCPGTDGHSRPQSEHIPCPVDLYRLENQKWVKDLNCTEVRRNVGPHDGELALRIVDKKRIEQYYSKDFELWEGAA